MFDRARAVLTTALDERAFPAAVCQVGRDTGALWTEAFGRLTYDPAAAAATVSTPFDLASLTKVIATTSIVMSAMRRGLLAPETLVSETFDAWRGDARNAITVGHLLDHSSGLPATMALTPSGHSRQDALPSLLEVPLERPPGAASVYSDVGFMVLGFLLEAIDGRTLDVQWRELWSQRPEAGAPDAALEYCPAPESRSAIAPTEVDPSSGAALQGVVHDENARILGGVAAHAGLFGRAAGVGAFAAWILRTFHETTWLGTPAFMRTVAARRPVPGSSRALGWDTMLPTSSCGTRMSPTAIGHTGFTGTSLWIDYERNLYFVLLTNRVHPSRTNEAFLPYRARFHNAAMDDLGWA